MPKRQTIVLLVAAIAVIYGLYQVLFTRPFRPAPKIKDSQTKISAQFATDLYKKMAKGGLSKTGEYILSRASTDWGKDVFLAYNLPLSDKADNDLTESDARVFNLNYSGYLETQNMRLAIINGREYEEGEELEEKGLIVRRISPTRIMIGEKGKKKKFSVQLAELNGVSER